eukprot:TRINITY_DN1908_c0_g1_i2.p1 TRINITY_DN1908_c0_g1~~TRINITY_DN1908_c0_g1_i2.p1  ORF type:complete len:112 (-),score=23.48 TRINITY_DN1908_c0_g1_i2:16-351(-)
MCIRDRINAEYGRATKPNGNSSPLNSLEYARVIDITVSSQMSNPLPDAPVNLCSTEKQVYDTCFLAWYNEKFLKFKAKELECEPEWAIYQACLQKKNGGSWCKASKKKLVQ